MELGEANWLMDYSGEFPVPTWDLVLYGRANRPSRARTLEFSRFHRAPKAHSIIDRAVDTRKISDNGEMMEKMNELADGDVETADLFEAYHDTEIEARLKMFRKVGSQLYETKKMSDRVGTVEGQSGRLFVIKLVHFTDKLKNDVFVPGPDGPVLLFIGSDQRTCVGIDVKKGG